MLTKWHFLSVHKLLLVLLVLFRVTRMWHQIFLPSANSNQFNSFLTKKFDRRVGFERAVPNAHQIHLSTAHASYAWHHREAAVLVERQSCYQLSSLRFVQLGFDNRDPSLFNRAGRSSDPKNQCVHGPNKQALTQMLPKRIQSTWRTFSVWG
jgi:hypothetical protein